jgi:hypothetical protein
LLGAKNAGVTTSKEDFHALIDPLSLAISLGVICRTELEINSSQLEQAPPQFTSENPIFVRD